MSKHRVPSSIVHRIPVPARRKLNPLDRVVLIAAATAIILAVLAIAFAPKADAAVTPPPNGHTPVTVCHDPVHHAVVIVVDDDSTKLKGHLGHKAALGDLIEGIDGTAAQIIAACHDEQPTTPPTSPTTDPTTPPVTTTTEPTTPTTSPTTEPTVPPTTTTSHPVIHPTTHPTRPAIQRPRATTIVTHPHHTTPPTADVPVLAHTGTQTEQLALLALGLLTAGALAQLGRRTITRRH